jgi:RNA polymerase sigma factor (sigma-70 family)
MLRYPKKVTAHMGSSLDEWRICKEAIHRLLEKRGWRLLGISEDDLVSATLDDLHNEGCALGEASIKRCGARQYVVAFHRACRADGTQLQVEAFQCLGERLARIVLHKTGDEDQAKDCAQRALRIIYEKLDTCADPKCFFSWTRAIVLHELYQDLRQKRRHPQVSLDETPDFEGEEVVAGETNIGQSTVEAPENLFAEAEGDIAAKQLLQQVQQVLGESRQWQVVAEFYLNGRSYSEIAALLHTTTNNVYLIMHRAIQKLRSDSQLMQELRGFFDSDRS